MQRQTELLGNPENLYSEKNEKTSKYRKYFDIYKSLYSNRPKHTYVSKAGNSLTYNEDNRRKVNANVE